MMDAVALAAAIRDGEVSCVDVVLEALARIEDRDRYVRSISVVLEEEALAAARAAESVLLAREAVGPLHGVPLSIKDVIWMRGVPATNGAVAFREFHPTEDAVVVRRLRAAGAIPVGKTNNAELCMHFPTDNAVHGLTRNPWDLTRTPGGSSGGAGASVALGLTPVAIGSDGGGSIRIPASFCGVAGLKPTFGLVPRGPGFPGWRTLTVNGPLARTVRDLALALDVMAGPDPSDDLALPPLGGRYLDAAMSPSIDGLRIAACAEPSLTPLEPGVRRAFSVTLDRLADAGWPLELACPDLAGVSSLWSTISACEGYAAYGWLLESALEQLHPRTVELLRAGERHSLTDYFDALEERTRIARRWLELFERYDLLVTPTVELTAFPVGVSGPSEIDGHPIDPETNPWGVFSAAPNLTGQPAASVPCGFDDDGLPVGLQIVGRRGEDDVVLSAAAAFESLLPWQGGYDRLDTSAMVGVGSGQ